MQNTGINFDIQVNGITINYDDAGKSNIPIVFIHGFPFDKSMWEPQLEYFKSKYRVISYDIRGYGKSTKDKRIASIDLFAEDLIKLLEVLKIDKVVACGLSMGGYILLNALNKFPEKFEAVILADTQCIGDSTETKVKRKKSILQIDENGLHDFAASFVKNIFCKDIQKSNKKIVNKIESLILSISPQTITETLNALAQRKEMCTSLSDISIPVLILCGEEDSVTPLSQSNAMHSTISGSKFLTISGAGHMSNLEQPEVFNKYVDNFISNIIK